MSIYKGSRYEYSTVDFIAKSKYAEATPIVFYNISSLNTLTYTEHVYILGERLDQLSTRYYNTPKKWWVIVEANPEILDFFHIPIGTIIRIPNV